MDVKTDFKQLVNNLKSSGIGNDELAKLADCSPHTIRALSRGENDEPRYSTGNALAKKFEIVFPDTPLPIKDRLKAG